MGKRVNSKPNCRRCMYPLNKEVFLNIGEKGGTVLLPDKLVCEACSLGIDVEKTVKTRLAALERIYSVPLES